MVLVGRNTYAQSKMDIETAAAATISLFYESIVISYEKIMEKKVVAADYTVFTFRIPQVIVCLIQFQEFEPFVGAHVIHLND